MLVDQDAGCHRDPHEVPDAEPRPPAKQYQCRDREPVERLREEDAALEAEPYDGTPEPHRPIEPLVRQGIEDIEPRDPGRDREGDRDEDPPGMTPPAGDGQVAAHRRDREA